MGTRSRKREREGSTRGRGTGNKFFSLRSDVVAEGVERHRRRLVDALRQKPRREREPSPARRPARTRTEREAAPDLDSIKRFSCESRARRGYCEREASFVERRERKSDERTKSRKRKKSSSIQLQKVRPSPRSLASSLPGEMLHNSTTHSVDPVLLLL